MWRLRGRHNIDSVRRARRSASGPVWVRWIAEPDAATPPEVGYAIGRVVGTAVTRNLLRRRLRAAVASFAGDLLPGRYLIGVGPGAAHLSYSDLAVATRSCLMAADALSS